jgi:hypothetical protein
MFVNAGKRMVKWDNVVSRTRVLQKESKKSDTLQTDDESRLEKFCHLKS